MQKHLEQNDDAEWLETLLVANKEVFGELPKPGSCAKVVSMDLQLKPEFEGSTLRSKCFPMSREDAEEMERQVQELLLAGLVSEYKGKEFPKFCSPTFLVEKDKNKAVKTSKTKEWLVITES